MSDLSPRRIEEIEKDMLIELGWILKNSLKDFSTSVDRSLGYLDKIALSIIMASKQDKSYNPFSEIIEKYVLHILINKFEKRGYNFLPLGYSADLTLESNRHILNIDIKTANINNLSDFKQTINVGINQMTHVAKLRLNQSFLPPPYFVYPTIHPFYEMPDGSKKLILTYGLMFIYPSYHDLIEKIRKEYLSLFELFKERVKNVLVHIVSKNLNISKEEMKKILEERPEKSRYSREELISESLIRGVFIHKQERKNILHSLQLSLAQHKVVEEFEDRLTKFVEELRERNIKPIAIIAISLPNGLLKDKYLDKFVSGKDYARSARYHYKDGIFEVIKEETGEEHPRVIFLDLNMDYFKDLKQYFGKIVILEWKWKIL